MRHAVLSRAMECYDAMWCGEYVALLSAFAQIWRLQPSRPGPSIYDPGACKLSKNTLQMFYSTFWQLVFK